MTIELVKETKNPNWNNSAKDGFPIRISIHIGLDQEMVRKYELNVKFPNISWRWGIKNNLRTIIFSELVEIVGERKVQWRTESQREYWEDNYLHIYVADDNWLVEAKLKDAIVARLPRSVAILEKFHDPVPVYPDAN